jgi:GTP diphosphokinase / guanosine-3',5'-bis(diphosphate) 3'-diphosphatase
MDFSSPLKPLLDYLDDDQIKTVMKAYRMADKAHAGQMRLTGEPYITHPVQVACILAQMKFDYETLTAALLHDALEDTSMTKETIRKAFGKTVEQLISGVTKLTLIKFKSHDLEEAENFRKMLLAMSKDIRVVIIKLVDRLHNIRTVEAHTLKKRKAIASETLDIFAPIGRRLGMHDLALELEDLSFQHLYPMRYRVLKNAVQRVQGSHYKILEEIKETIGKQLRGLSLDKNILITAREKHLYSIYHKMSRKNISFFDITDVYGVRIVVNSVTECYMALGAVHSIYRPAHNRFRDYIAVPKDNGYQSLHTVLFGLHGVPIEVQIRTHQMSDHAQTGICAHWRYKSKTPIDDKTVLQTKNWLNNLMAIQLTDDAPERFISEVKEELFPNDIYVFTPRGKIIELPKDATAIDFAFAVHTDIGLHAILAKIDRELAPLSSVLRNGHTVEIITTEDASPNASCLNFVVTSRARNLIKQHLASKHHDTLEQEGKKLLEHALHASGVNMEEILSVSHDQLLKRVKKKSIKEVYISLARGEIEVDTMLMIFGAQFAHQKDGRNTLKVESGDKMHCSACCQPLPGDVIVSELDRKKGIVIHRDSCAYVMLNRRKKTFDILSWGTTDGQVFDTTIKLTVANRYGMLAKLATLISNLKINIVDVHVEHSRSAYIEVCMVLKVSSLLQLNEMIKRLSSEKSFVNIHRFDPRVDHADRNKD